MAQRSLGVPGHPCARFQRISDQAEGAWWYVSCGCGEWQRECATPGDAADEFAHHVAAALQGQAVKAFLAGLMGAVRPSEPT